MASEKYYIELGNELERNGLGLDEKYIESISIFSNGGEGYPPSTMKKLVLNHPNFSSVKMIYYKDNQYYVFTRSRKSMEELLTIFNTMISVYNHTEGRGKYGLKIIKIKSR